MSHYTVTIPGDQHIHASPTERGTVLYCEPGRRIHGKVIHARVTCQECRQVLTLNWLEMLNAKNVNSFYIVYQDERGSLTVRQIDHVPHEREPFVRVHFTNGLHDFYTLAHFLNYLVDGNAYRIRKPEDSRAGETGAGDNAA